jgi:hypothetical protein
LSGAIGNRLGERRGALLQGDAVDRSGLPASMIVEDHQIVRIEILAEQSQNE